MSNARILLTAWTDWAKQIVWGAGAIITLLTLYAFWPRWKESTLARTWTENKKLKAIIATMTIEEVIKSEIIQSLQDEKKSLENELITQHREQLDGAQRTENPKGPSRR